MKTGKTLLLVSGILILIDAILSAIGLIMAITAIVAAAGLAGGVELASVAGIIAIISLVIAGIGIIFDIFAGYFGIQAFRKGDKKSLNRAFVFGIIILVLTILSVMGLFGGTASGLTWFSGIYGIIVSILYVIGAFMVKNAMKNNSKN